MVVNVTTVVAWGGVDCKGALAALSRVMKMFSPLDGGLGYTGIYICQNSLNCMYIYDLDIVLCVKYTET